MDSLSRIFKSSSGLLRDRSCYIQTAASNSIISSSSINSGSGIHNGTVLRTTSFMKAPNESWLGNVGLFVCYHSGHVDGATNAMCHMGMTTHSRKEERRTNWLLLLLLQQHHAR